MLAKRKETRNEHVGEPVVEKGAFGCKLHLIGGDADLCGDSIKIICQYFRREVNYSFRVVLLDRYLYSQSKCGVSTTNLTLLDHSARFLSRTLFMDDQTHDSRFPHQKPDIS